MCIYAGPPSAPLNLSASDVTDTTVFLEWETPLDDGDRSDLSYTISHNISSDSYNTNDTSFLLENLIPSTHYEIHVTADNGVSSQDDAVDDRTVSVQIMTITSEYIAMHSYMLPPLQC